MSTYRALHDGWALHAASEVDELPDLPPGGVPASVPGCVHTDLLDAGVLPDPYLDRNENDLGWIGEADWRYVCHFDAEGPDGDRVELVADGLDTVAEISLNGHDLGRTANMHRSYRFDVGAALRAGDNELVVTFRSPISYAADLVDELGDRPRAYPHAFNFIRKMACNFGWDWGPTLVTAGIWRPIGLERWRTARMARVRPLVDLDGDTGRARVVVDLDRTGTDPLRVSAEVAGARSQVEVSGGAEAAEVEVTVGEVERWWPCGHGGQPLYDLQVTLAGDDGKALDTWSRRIGFRTVELDTSADEHGSAFTLVVNGRPVFVRGANWIPDDCFPTRVDRARYRERIAQAREANLNLLRVWGGGIYETRDFYEECDEQGLLVWQDFLFACAAYPEEEPLASEVEAEARQAVADRMSHPSLVLWNGNNENFWGFFDWGWREELAGRSWGRAYYLDVLPRIVAEIDPTRPYAAGSPYSGSLDVHPNADGHGAKHIWDVWNDRDYTAYREYVPRFLAEFGFQGPPTYATLRRAVSDEPLTPTSPGVLHHQKAIEGNEKLQRGLEPHFGVPAGFDEWLYLTQLNQARAIAYGVEHFRSHRPVCMGTVVWQLNDCWPVTSWAMIDGDGRRKPLWYAVRRAYAPRLLTVQPRGHGIAVIAVNDSNEPWSAGLTLARHCFDGTVLAEEHAALECAAGATATLVIPADVAAPDDPAGELVTVSDGERRALWFFAEDVDLDYPAPEVDTEVTRHTDGVAVTVTARTLVRDLSLFADRLDPDAKVHDQLVTLLPGESATFRVRTGRDLPSDELTAPPVLRSVGEALRVGARSGAA